MLHSLLVPLDGSEFSERSLPLARGIARATGAALHLAQVHVPYQPDQLLSNTQFHFEGLDLSEYDARHREEEREYLSRVEEQLGSDGTTVDSRLLEGQPVAHQLAEYAHETHADIILMTTHGRRGATRLWLGSVADTMLRHTHLPMLVIHPDHPGGVPADVLSVKHILVPLDGSDLAESVLVPTAEVALATEARVTLLRVLTPSAAPSFRFFPFAPWRREPLREGTLEYLEGLADGLRAQGLEVAVLMEHAEEAPPTITDIAGSLGADLIAMATHGHSGMKRALLGSVADEVLRTSPLPLLMLRPPSAH